MNIDFPAVGDMAGEFFGGIVAPLIERIFGPLVPVIQVMSAVLTVVFIAGIIYVVVRWREIGEIEYLKYRHIPFSERELQERSVEWFRVQQHIESENPAEWRLAILSADSILETVLRERGYAGDTVGERLKAVSPADLPSLAMAWEAHKLRNRVAHEGASFEISRRDARRAIAQFERVFTDLHYI